MFIPPCRDPFNYNIHPLVINGIERVSHAMIERFLAEEKPGVTIRTGARYSTWFNGGLSTACQFHNMIGLFTETIGSPTPVADSAAHQQATADERLPRADPAARVALPPVGRLPRDREQGAARLRVAEPAAPAPQHLADGQATRSIAATGISWSITPKIVKAAGGDRASPAPGPGGGGGRGGWAAAAAVGRRQTSTSSSTTPRSATLAAISSRPTSRTS